MLRGGSRRRGDCDVESAVSRAQQTERFWARQVRSATASNCIGAGKSVEEMEQGENVRVYDGGSAMGSMWSGGGWREDVECFDDNGVEGIGETTG